MSAKGAFEPSGEVPWARGATPADPARLVVTLEPDARPEDIQAIGAMLLRIRGVAAWEREERTVVVRSDPGTTDAPTCTVVVRLDPGTTDDPTCWEYVSDPDVQAARVLWRHFNALWEWRNLLALHAMHEEPDPASLDCSACEVRPYPRPSLEWMHLPNHAGCVHPCSAHPPVRPYAWLALVDVEAALPWLQAQKGAFEVRELYRFLPRA